MNSYKILFHFESGEYALLEIKRILDQETDKSKLYFWLLYDKSNSTLKKLNFVSMSQDEDNQIRTFEHEHLAFDTQIAVLFSADTEYFMDVLSVEEELAIVLKQAIYEFLDKTELAG
ncbi:MAG: hypothetical protein PHT07_05945 [Paludibacter sp.]|nr:hypothetical protein [Paludibacter sp.]